MTAGVELVCIMQGANGRCLLEYRSDSVVIWGDVILLQAMRQQPVLGNNDFVKIFRAQRGKVNVLCLSHSLKHFPVIDQVC